MIYFIWFANALVYYGLSLNTNDLNGNPFWNFFLLGAVEVPAYLTCMYVVKVYGHKRTLLTTMVGAGVGCLAAISIDCMFTGQGLAKMSNVLSTPRQLLHGNGICNGGQILCDQFFCDHLRVLCANLSNCTEDHWSGIEFYCG